jgi:hypothetical protein
MRITIGTRGRRFIEAIVVLLLACSCLQRIACASPARVSAYPGWIPIILGAQERDATMRIRGMPSQGFALTASLEPAVVPSGGRPVLTVALQNVTPEPLRMLCSHPERFLAVVVEDSNGKVLAPKQGSAAPGLISQMAPTLKSGDVRVWHYQLGDMYELGSPGEYRVTVGRQVPWKGEWGGPSAYVVANTVTLTVTGGTAPSSAAREAGVRLFAHTSLSASDVASLMDVTSRTLDGLRLTSMLPRASAVSGQRVALAVVLQNVGVETMSCWESSLSERDMRCIVEGPLGIVLPTVEGLATIEGRIVAIRPGETVNRDFDVNRFYDLSAPGEYRITAVRRMPTPRGWAFLVSNTVVLTVAPKP